MPTLPYQLPERVLRNRGFALLWAAVGVWTLADRLSAAALLSEVDRLGIVDAARARSLALFGFLAAVVFLGLAAGWLADRFERRRTMVGAALLRAAGIAVLLAAIPALPAGRAGDVVLLLSGVLLGSLTALLAICSAALLPKLVRRPQLLPAAAIIIATAGGGVLVGEWAANTRVFNPSTDGGRAGWIVHPVCAAGFVGGALLISLLSIRDSSQSAPKPERHRRRSFVYGFRYIRTHRRAVELILLGALLGAAAAVVIAVAPAVAGAHDATLSSDRPISPTALLAGLTAGAGVLAIIGFALPIPLLVLGALLGGAFWALLLAAAALLDLHRSLSAVILFVVGAHGAGLLAAIPALLTRFTPDALRGRVLGIAVATTVAAAGVGSLVLAPLERLDRYAPALLALLVIALLWVLRSAWYTYRAREESSPQLSVVWKTVRFCAVFWWGLRRVGPCTLPRRGPVILAANHNAGVDPLLLEVASPHRPIGFLVAQEFYSRPVAGWVMSLVECVPINRSNPQKSFLVNSLKLLRRGGCLGIFPQGGIRPPDDAQPPKPGVGLLALRTGAPVIPAYVWGTIYHPSPMGSLLMRHRARVRFGKPIDLSAFEGRARDKAAAQEVTELIMQRIAALAPGGG